MPRIDAFLELGRQQGCSDIHFTVGMPPLVRIDGVLEAVKYRELTREEIQSMVEEIMGPVQREEFDTSGSVDVSYTAEDEGRYRINVCKQAQGLSAVCRVIPNKVIPLSKLGLPPSVRELAGLNAGLVLVTGATGTGKSSTLAGLVDEVNHTRSSTVITLEDPIEFRHESDKSLVIQRELGTNVRSYAEGLRSALRQDPDVILVGELRDHETISLALEASETGHLVLASLHTRGAVQTIDRILDAFPPESHNQVRTTLGENLRCVVSQGLVRTSDGRGRRAAVEVMMVIPAVAQLIRDGKTFQIPSTMATGRRHGMQLMDQSLLALVRAGDVDPDEAFLLAKDKREFLPFVTDTDILSIAEGLIGNKSSAA